MTTFTRTFIVALVSSLLMVSFDTTAQQTGKVPRVGFLWIGSPGTPSPFIEAFEQGLRELGWVDGQNVAMQYRYAAGKAERFPDLTEMQGDIAGRQTGPCPENRRTRVPSRRCSSSLWRIRIGRISRASRKRRT